MNKNNIVVSIVTIVYNGVETLEKTIQNVLSQTYEHIEYIIIDGGSTDGSLDIIRKYEKDIYFWASEPDKGISDAFNKGINRTTGDLIGIINADDQYAVDTVEKVVDIYMKNSLKNKLFIHGDLIHPNYSKNGDLYIESRDGAHHDLMKGKMGGILSPTVFVSRELYDLEMFDLGYKYAMDYDLFIRWYQHHGPTFVYIPALLAYMDPNGLTARAYEKSLGEVIKSYKHRVNSNPFTYPVWFNKFRIFRVRVKRLLERLGLNLIITFYRDKVTMPGNVRKH